MPCCRGEERRERNSRRARVSQERGRLCGRQATYAVHCIVVPHADKADADGVRLVDHFTAALAAIVGPVAFVDIPVPIRHAAGALALVVHERADEEPAVSVLERALAIHALACVPVSFELQAGVKERGGCVGVNRRGGEDETGGKEWMLAGALTSSPLR